MKKEYQYLTIITGIFTASLLIANTLDTKIFAFGQFTLPAGIVVFPIAYVIGDVLTEVYGFATSRKVIWTGFIALVLMVFSYEIARRLPPATFWTHQDAYNEILGKVPRLVLASIAAYFLGEFCNSYILAKMKVWMKGKLMPLRFVASTVIGQAVDTSVFVLVAFAGVFSAAELVSITLSGWAFKVAWEVIALPITIIFVRFLKRAENEDHYDTNTDFNPFRVLGRERETK